MPRMNTRFRLITNTLLIALLCGSSAGMGEFAPGAPPIESTNDAGPLDSRSLLDVKPDRVIVFKNGYSLVVKSARARCDENGDVYTTDVPPSAVLGTFWVTSQDRQVRSVRATTHSTSFIKTHTARAQNIAELIAANSGREVTLHTRNMPKPEYRGVIADILDGRPAEDGVENRVRTEVAQYAALRESTGEVTIIPLTNIASLADSDIQTLYSHNVDVHESEKRLIVSMGKENAGRDVTLSIMYFTPGLRWIPTYKLEGVGEPTGRLSLQGELLNELEDFDHVPMSLVVGVPSFRFKDVVSPLSLEATMYNALAEAAPQIMGRQAVAGQFSNAYYADRATETWRTSLPGGLPDPMDEGVGTGEQDLFVYDIGAFTMKKGDRAAIPLWATALDIKHVYSFDVSIHRDDRGACTVTDKFGGNDNNNSPLRLASNKVWHQLELKNATRGPWTTGAAMVFGGSVPISQEMLTYTPPGGTSPLPLTVATDIRGHYSEEEIAREPNVLRWGSHNYSKITKRCSVTLTSYRAADSATRVSVGMGGKAIELDSGGSAVITDTDPADWSNNWWAPVNNHSDVTWSLDLKAGESKTLSFTVEYYVP